jgi:glucose repression regulatory protein TUP1
MDAMKHAVSHLERVQQHLLGSGAGAPQAPLFQNPAFGTVSLPGPGALSLNTAATATTTSNNITTSNNNNNTNNTNNNNTTTTSNNNNNININSGSFKADSGGLAAIASFTNAVRLPTLPSHAAASNAAALAAASALAIAATSSGAGGASLAAAAAAPPPIAAGAPVVATATASVASATAAATGEWAVHYDETAGPGGHGRAAEIGLLSTLQHDSVVCAVATSGNGNLLATGCNRQIRLFDANTYANVQSVPMQFIGVGSTAESALAVAAGEGKGELADVYVRAVAFSPDSRYVAGGAEKNTVAVWDIERRSVAAMLTGHDVDIYAVQWSRDGKLIATGSGDKTVKLWDWAAQACVRTFGGPSSTDGPQDGVTSVAMSPDSASIAVASLDRTIRVWDVATGELKGRMQGHVDSVYSIAFSPDGKMLASGSLDRSLRLWDVQSYACATTLAGHRDYVLSVAFLPQTRSAGEWYLLSGSKDRTVNVWDVRRNDPLAVLYGHKNSVISVAMHPTRNIFVTGSGDCRARLWSLKFAQ